VNHTIYLICLWGFLVLPAVLLCLRAARPAFMRWWLLLVLVSIGGWILVNGAIHFYYAHLDDLLLPYGDHPPKDLMERRSADGAKLVFGLFFGWLYGLIYLTPWILIYGFAQLSRRLFHAALSTKHTT
jgi:hypothetical protein